MLNGARGGAEDQQRGAFSSTSETPKEVSRSVIGGARWNGLKASHHDGDRERGGEQDQQRDRVPEGDTVRFEDAEQVAAHHDQVAVGEG